MKLEVQTDKATFYTVVLLTLIVLMTTGVYLFSQEVYKTYIEWTKEDRRRKEAYRSWETGFTREEGDDEEYDMSQDMVFTDSTKLLESQTLALDSIGQRYQALKEFKTRNELPEPERVVSTERPNGSATDLFLMKGDYDDYEYPQKPDKGVITYMFGQSRNFQTPTTQEQTQTEIEALRTELAGIRGMLSAR